MTGYKKISEMLLLLILCMTLETRIIWAKRASVVDLTRSKDFGSSIAPYDTVLTLYLSSVNEQQSKIMEPQFECTATILKNFEIPMVLAKVDCSENITGKQICVDNHVFETPSLKLYEDGQFLQDLTALNDFLQLTAKLIYFVTNEFRYDGGNGNKRKTRDEL